MWRGFGIDGQAAGRLRLRRFPGYRSLPELGPRVMLFANRESLSFVRLDVDAWAIAIGDG